MLSNQAIIKVVSADISSCIQEITDRKIMLFDIIYENSLTVIFSVSPFYVGAVKSICKKRGYGFEIIKESPFVTKIKSYKKRWVLFVGILVLFTLSVWIPKHIFFYEVYGNTIIPDSKIISCVTEYGLNFGCRNAAVNSEYVKDRMMEELPHIEWLGIRVRGCVAEIHIREKEIPESYRREHTINSIVSSKDGVIDSLTVVRGIPLCSVGQAVEKGQVLISGYEDCGLFLRGTNASGEIFAKTNHSYQLVAPHPVIERKQEKEKRTVLSLQFGKNIINFNNYSGISPTECVKISRREFLTLPGGFQLPVSLNIQQIISYEYQSPEQYSVDDTRLQNSLDQYVLQIMNAGEILHKKYEFVQMEDTGIMYGIYACREEIGSIRIEEILNYNGKNDGTNS